MKRTLHIALVFSLLLSMSISNMAFAEQSLISTKVATPPVIDGDINEQTWQAIKPVSIKDQASGNVILLRSVYSGDKVYFSVWFSDSVKNPLHKPWIWDKDKEAYETGAHREDTFVFKWNMMDKKVDLSNFSDGSYTADVWYWKANRTNPAGYADDKNQELSDSPSKKATELESPAGKKRFLVRRSDQGKPAYNEFKPTTFTEAFIDRYPESTPEGSRADVIAKGEWQGGYWTIEFERKLDTGHNDDVKFNLSKGKEYLFGVSIFSLYGRPHDPNSPNLYGRGRISEPLLLSFQ
jgi:hypothetical protein